MFDSEFYPTPKEVIEKMLAPYSRILSDYKTNVLEPSAGKGDIIDFIKEKYYRGVRNFYCIEKDPNLQHILRDKGYKLIDSDFLKYSSNRQFDLIAMNPPFSNGDEHLLKAWQILKNGHIVCLLNKETIDNPYTKKRKLLASIIEEFGSVEYIGAAFSNSERTTNVEVALVCLQKQTKDDILLDFGNLKREEFKPLDLGEDRLENQVAVNNQIGNAVIAYKNMLSAFEEIAIAMKKFDFYASAFEKEDSYSKGQTSRDIFEKLSKSNYTNGHNEVYSVINNQAWGYIFRSLNQIKYRFTSKIQDDFYSLQKQQGEMEFSEENINAVLDMIMLNRDTLMQRAIVDVFDYFTLYHKENRVHIEGWKTNSHYKVNKKVILPNIMRQDYTGELRIDFSSKLDDIDKALCFINADRFEAISTIKRTIENRLYWNKKNGVWNNQTESTYFNIRFFKKGTVHLTFKDRFIWEQFNKTAVGGKEWLPTKN